MLERCRSEKSRRECGRTQHPDGYVTRPSGIWVDMERAAKERTTQIKSVIG